MKLSLSLVAVKKISPITDSNFDNARIQELANAILAAEGIINPIVLRRKELDAYQVIAGDFEYYAAAKAREIDPKKGEMIGAFILEEDKAEAIQTQINLLRSSSIEEKQPPVREPDYERLALRLTNLESKLDSKIKAIEIDYNQKIETLNNQLEAAAITPKTNQIVDPLTALNTFSLPQLLNYVRGKKIQTICKNIVEERDRKGQFSSFENMIERTKGLGDKTIISIIDDLSRR